jgi:hypothetical protein
MFLTGPVLAFTIVTLGWTVAANDLCVYLPEVQQMRQGKT